MDKQMKGTILVALSGVLYGTIGYFGTGLFHAGLSVIDLLFWRFLSSVLWLMLFGGLASRSLDIWRGFSRYEWQTLGLFFVLGAICYGGGTVLYFQSSFLIGTGLAMVLFFTYPLLVVAYSALSQRRWPAGVTWLSLLLIIIGCMMIGCGDIGQVNWEGIILAVISGMAYGVYILASKDRASVVSPLLATFTVCLGNVVGFWAYILVTNQVLYWPQNSSVIWNIALFGLIGTVLPILLLLQGVKLVSATKTAIISVLEPVTVLLVGVWFLNEPVSWIQGIGAVVILSSALVIQLARE
jgi:drug/metabolite transporter (DMT)-like permease